MKTIAVIPVKGRLPLLKVTLERLYEKNGVNHIICIGDSREEEIACLKSGAEFVYHENKPLGRKWNAGFLIAKQYKPDFILYVGSSDWLSDNWLDITLPIAEKYYMVGKFDYYMLHYGKQWFSNKIHKKLVYWPHYPPGSKRRNEPIGIGRVLNRDFLNAVLWQPFVDHWNGGTSGGMDYAMWRKLGILQQHSGRKPDKLNEMNCFVVKNDNLKSLSLSCYKWSNMHDSDFRFNHIEKIDNVNEFLVQWFPEAMTLEF